MEDGQLYCAVWSWRNEVKVFLVRGIGDEPEAQSEVRHFVGESGTITVTEVE